jgi:hypothetical protein
MVLASKIPKGTESLSRRLFRLNNRRKVDHASNALAAVTATPAFLDITILQSVQGFLARILARC